MTQRTHVVLRSGWVVTIRHGESGHETTAANVPTAKRLQAHLEAMNADEYVNATAMMHDAMLAVGEENAK